MPDENSGSVPDPQESSSTAEEIPVDSQAVVEAEPVMPAEGAAPAAEPVSEADVVVAEATVSEPPMGAVVAASPVPPEGVAAHEAAPSAAAAPPPPPPAAYAPPPPPAAYAPPPAAPAISETKSKVAAGVLGILLGSFGIHKFYLGYNKEGIIMLLVTVLSFGFLAWVTSIVGLVEGIIYLTKTDEEFNATYVVGRKPWF